MAQLPESKASDQPSLPFVQPGWHYSVICPDGYDFVQPWCRLRGVVEEGPRDHIPPSDVGSLAFSARQIAISAAAGADVTAAKAEMAMVGSGLALLIAFIALLTANLKPRRPA